MDNSSIQTVVIDIADNPHLLDHLLPLCDLFQAPLFSRDIQNERLAQKYYPPVEIVPIISLELSKEEIADRFDLLIHPNFWPIGLIQGFFEKDSLRALYTPHGNSDKNAKKYWMEHFAIQDSSLIYGEHMVDYLREKKVYDQIKNPFFVGNLRHRYYLKHKPFFDQIIEKEIHPHLNPSKQTLIYAPTFSEISSFFQIGLDWIQALSDAFNLIIKLHPKLTEEHPELIYPFIGKVQKMQNIVVCTDFPLVYPLLEISDGYIGDFSSVGYDFLTYNRPLFFIRKSDMEDQRLTTLHQCGLCIDPKKPSQTLLLIQEHMINDPFTKIREHMYQYTFKKTTDQKLKHTILQTLFGSQK